MAFKLKYEVRVVETMVGDLSYSEIISTVETWCPILFIFELTSSEAFSLVGIDYSFVILILLFLIIVAASLKKHLGHVKITM